MRVAFWLLFPRQTVFQNFLDFEKVYDGFISLHILNLKGEGNSAEAKAIRDSLDEPWFNLSDEQQEKLNRMVTKLNHSY